MELTGGPEGGGEHLFTAVRLPQQRHRDGPGLTQKNSQAPPFLSGEIGKAVHKHVLPLDVAGRLQMIAQLGHPVPLVQARPAEPGLIGPVEQAQVQELVPGGPGHLPGFLVQGPGRHVIATQLVKEVQELAQKGGLPGGSSVHRQAWSHLQKRLLQRQQLAAAVQRHLGRAAGDAQDPVPQPPKAQHLGMAAGGGAAGPAQVHLRLVGGVLRHQKNLLAPVPQLRDAAEDRF